MTTPPLSSSSSTTSSPSMSFKSSAQSLHGDSTDFDTQETLELLLQTITQSLDSPTTRPSPGDWPNMPSWGMQDSKSAEFASDFNFAFPMDLDFDPTMAVDPSALHFNTSMFSQPALTDNQYLMSTVSQDDMASTSVFANGQSMWAPDVHLETRTGRRLSITSSSSSSGASLSPILEPQSTAGNSPSSSSSDCGDYSLNESDAASELAQRVRQTAGVTLAVPVSMQVQQLAAASSRAKLPIPRLARPTSPSLKRGTSVSSSPPTSDSSASNSPASTPPLDMSDPALLSPGQGSNADSSVIIGVSGRPKTSHTTIERRYRTNLNARITGLKQAVPALRVLELRNSDTSPYNDVVDSRGFVDGVKVARKMSKANVLGKATEYIRVLKKRESRLKREQDGLKSLVSGLVGGPALLREWEREWRDKFGGEEKDEIEGDDAAVGSDDEDGDGEDSDGEDGEEGRAKKKAKVVKPAKKEKPSKPVPPPQAPLVPGALPEKRKRGRPRKVPLPAAISAPITLQPIEGSVAVMNMPHQTAMQAPQEFVVPTASGTQPAQQYLLAAFAFFSVFNSPLSPYFTRRSNSYEHSHEHHGSVLTAHPSMVPTHSFVPTARSYGIHEMVQAFHLLVSTLVFFYIVFPWLSGALRRNWASGALQKLRSTATRGHVNPVPTPSPSPTTLAYQRVVLTDALSQTARGSAHEADRLRCALGVSAGLYGLMQSVIKAAKIDRGLEMNQLEQRAWVRLGELVAFDGSVSRTTRLQTYWCMSWRVSTFATSTSDLTTLALIIFPVSRGKASELWERARNQELLRPYEKIVLANMSVENAADWLAKWQRWHNTERRDRCAACEKRTPLGILAAIMTRERLRKHAAAMFVRTVVPRGSRVEADDAYSRDAEEFISEFDPEQEEHDDQERRETIEAGKSIGGRTAELAMLLERIWDTGFCTHEDVPNFHTGQSGRLAEDFVCEDGHDLARSDESEIRTLLIATLIYRRIFPSSFPSCATAVSVILSPPPSPSRKNLALHVSLRAALASAAFDFDSERLKDERLGAKLEDARDRVNDMLTALERSVRRNARV